LRRIFSNPALAKTTAWTKRSDLLLIALAIFGIGLHTLSELTRRMNPQPHLSEKLAAAARTDACFDAIREARLGVGASPDVENDPEQSGLIGQEFTVTTTDRGVLEAKLTSVNPNFAAVFVQYFRELGLKPGDPVAVALTGSFPALNIAVLAAAEELRLAPIAITSIGASMWGANDPNFTWLDMESLLIKNGLLKTRSVAASIGGSNDRGRGLSPKGRSLLRQSADRNGVQIIWESTLEHSVAKRVEIYDLAAGPRGVRAYANIGGGSASVGTQQSADLIRPGISRSLKRYNWTQRGVLHHYAGKRVPVIHLLNVERVAEDHGLPITPESVPPVGEGEIFYREAYDLRITVPSLLVYLVLCFGVLRERHRAARAARHVVAPVLVSSPAAEPIGERSGG